MVNWAAMHYIIV